MYKEIAGKYGYEEVADLSNIGDIDLLELAELEEKQAKQWLEEKGELPKHKIGALSQYDIDDIEATKEAILEGKIYAKIVSVSRSGMSRSIIFYYIQEEEGRSPFLVNCTQYIAWLHGENVGKYVYSNGNKRYKQDGFRVNGCGMDMILWSLYYAMPYDTAKNWDQEYTLI